MKAENQQPNTKELLLLEGAFLKLADYLEHLAARQSELSSSRDRGRSTFDRKVHESKIEAGELLDKAVAIGGFESKKGLRRQVVGRKFKYYPDFGHSNAFEYACLTWIPKQTDGFDFNWKRKQVGDVRAYALALRYLAGCLVKPTPPEGNRYIAPDKP